MEWNEILKNLTSNTGLAALGSVFGAFTLFIIQFVKNKYDYRIQSRNQEKDSFQVILQERRLEREENRKEIHKLRDQLAILQVKVLSLEGLVAQRPFPEWSLSSGRFLWCNIAMDRLFLAPLGFTAAGIIGKTPLEIWTKDVGEIITRLDMAARSSEFRVAFKHNVEINNNLYTIIKYGSTDLVSGQINTYYGMAIPQTSMLGD